MFHIAEMVHDLKPEQDLVVATRTTATHVADMLELKSHTLASNQYLLLHK